MADASSSTEEGRPSSEWLVAAQDQPPVLLLHGLGATGALNWASCFEHAGVGRQPDLYAGALQRAHASVLERLTDKAA